MGIIGRGILGGFRNKTGTVVGAFWRGLDIIRALPRKSGKAPTEKQLNQQAKFRLITEFLVNIGALIQDGYKASSKVAMPMNEAVRDNLEVAITGVAPNFTIDYTKVVFSKGSIEVANNLILGGLGSGKVTFTWDYDETREERNSDGTDTVNLMLYCPTQGKFVTLRNAAERADKSFALQCPSDFVGEQVHGYLSFHSVKRAPASSKSAYVGHVLVI